MLKYCPAPWNTIHIKKNGAISSCFCEDWHQKGLNGNLLATPLVELFNNDWQEQFRQSITDQTFTWCRAVTCVDFYRMEQLDILPNHPKLPTTIQLQIDQNCNLKCAICRPRNIYSPEINPTAYAILERLIKEYEQFNHKVNIHCDGSGDVFASAAYLKFFNREDLPKCFYFNIQTNGNLLTKNVDILTKIQDQIEMVEVSLDAATDDTYKEVRGGNLNIVKQGIQLLKELGLTVWTQYVVHQKNYKEILDYINMCKQLNVDKICLQVLFRLPHMNNQWWNLNKINNNTNIDIEYLMEVISTVKNDPQVEVSGGFEYLLEKRIQIISR